MIPEAIRSGFTQQRFIHRFQLVGSLLHPTAHETRTELVRPISFLVPWERVATVRKVSIEPWLSQRVGREAGRGITICQPTLLRQVVFNLDGRPGEQIKYRRR